MVSYYFLFNYYSTFLFESIVYRSQPPRTYPRANTRVNKEPKLNGAKIRKSREAKPGSKQTRATKICLVLHRVLPRANSTCSALKGAEAAKKRCRKLPFRRGDVMQKFDRRRELASLYVPTILLIRLIRGETEKRASGYTLCIRLHPVCIMQEWKKETSIHRRATESDFISSLLFPLPCTRHPSSVISFFLSIRCGVLLAINFFFLFSSVKIYFYIYIFFIHHHLKGIFIYIYISISIFRDSYF